MSTRNDISVNFDLLYPVIFQSIMAACLMSCCWSTVGTQYSIHSEWHVFDQVFLRYLVPDVLRSGTRSTQWLPVNVFQRQWSSVWWTKPFGMNSSPVARLYIWKILSNFEMEDKYKFYLKIIKPFQHYNRIRSNLNLWKITREYNLQYIWNLLKGPFFLSAQNNIPLAEMKYIWGGTGYND